MDNNIFEFLPQELKLPTNRRCKWSILHAKDHQLWKKWKLASTHILLSDPLFQPPTVKPPSNLSQCRGTAFRALGCYDPPLSGKAIKLSFSPSFETVSVLLLGIGGQRPSFGNSISHSPSPPNSTLGNHQSLLCVRKFAFFGRNTNEIVQYMLFCDWFLSPGIIFSGSVHAVHCISAFFYCQRIFHCMDVTFYFFIQLLELTLGIIFTFWLVWILALWTFLSKFLCGQLFWFLLGVYLGLELLSHMVILCITWWGAAKLCSIEDASFYTLSSNAQVFQVLSQTLVIICLFNSSSHSG